MMNLKGRVTSFVLALAGAAMLVFSLATPAFAADNTLVRLSGSTRYDTMSAIANKVAEQAPWASDAIICSGKNYPYALVASGISSIAPIILTEPDNLSDQARAQLIKRKTEHVIIIGGESAVSANVYNEVLSIVKPVADANAKANGYALKSDDEIVERISGATRYETAQAVLESHLTVDSGGKVDSWWGDTVIVASGANYPDALSAGALTSRLSAPIVLANPTSGLTDGILGSLKKAGFTKALIIGGTGALSASVDTQLRKIGIASERIYGDTRYETSIAVAKYGLETMLIDNYTDEDGNAQSAEYPVLKMSYPIFATGSNFPDALAAGSLAHCYSAPIILVDGNASVASELCAQYKSQIVGGYIIGGATVVSNTLASTLASACGLALS